MNEVRREYNNALDARAKHNAFKSPLPGRLHDQWSALSRIADLKRLTVTFGFGPIAELPRTGGGSSATLRFDDDALRVGWVLRLC